LTEADRTLLLSVRAWASRATSPGCDSGGAAGQLQSERWRRLEPSWAARLSQACDARVASGRTDDAAAALAELEQLHRAAARVDLARVHPSWCVRALQDEAPAVRRAVVAMGLHGGGHPKSDRLIRDHADLAQEHPVHSEVMDWTRALWSERLVGGQPAQPEDPPAIAVLSLFSPRTGYLICRCAGQAKRALAGDETPETLSRPLQRERWNWFRNRLGTAGPEIRAQVRRDLASSATVRVPIRHQSAWLGLVTLARLLSPCEPFRLRWALQHWPYSLAKQIRSLMLPPQKRSAALLRGETVILKAAWLRLNTEGRLSAPWFTPPEPLS
jgi:hypothetical protein